MENDTEEEIFMILDASENSHFPFFFLLSFFFISRGIKEQIQVSEFVLIVLHSAQHQPLVQHPHLQPLHFAGSCPHHQALSSAPLTVEDSHAISDTSTKHRKKTTTPSQRKHVIDVTSPYTHSWVMSRQFCYVSVNTYP